MEFEVGDIQSVLTRIETTAGETPPPSVLTPLLALADGRADHVIASYQSSSEDGTTWHIVASAGRALITVDASSPRSAWTLDNTYAGDTLREGEQLDARLVRLEDVAAVQLVETTHLNKSKAWSFHGRWRLVLRDGGSVDIHASQRTAGARGACDAFAAHLMAALTTP